MTYVPALPTEDDQFDSSLTQSIENFEDEMKATFPPETYAKLRVLGSFIAQGHSVEESCILARLDPAKFSDLARENLAVRAFILFKEKVFKARLQKVIYAQAKSGDAKMAGWLLERKFASEFNSKPPDPGSDQPKHLLEQGVQFIRDSGDSTPLIQPHSKVVEDTKQIKINA